MEPFALGSAAPKGAQTSLWLLYPELPLRAEEVAHRPRRSCLGAEQDSVEVFRQQEGLCFRTSQRADVSLAASLQPVS